MENRLNSKWHQFKTTPGINMKWPQWKVTSYPASQAGTELGPAIFSQLQHLRGDIYIGKGSESFTTVRKWWEVGRTVYKTTKQILT